MIGMRDGVIGILDCQRPAVLFQSLQFHSERHRLKGDEAITAFDVSASGRTIAAGYDNGIFAVWQSPVVDQLSELEFDTPCLAIVKASFRMPRLPIGGFSPSGKLLRVGQHVIAFQELVESLPLGNGIPIVKLDEEVVESHNLSIGNVWDFRQVKDHRDFEPMSELAFISSYPRSDSSFVLCNVPGGGRDEPSACRQLGLEASRYRNEIRLHRIGTAARKSGPFARKEEEQPSVHDVDSGNRQQGYFVATEPVGDVTFTQDGMLAIRLGIGDEFRFYQVAKKEGGYDVKLVGSAEKAWLSASGEVAVMVRENRVKCLSVPERSELSSFDLDENQSLHGVTPDGRHVVVKQEKELGPTIIEFRPTNGGQSSYSLDGPRYEPEAIMISPDGRKMVCLADGLYIYELPEQLVGTWAARHDGQFAVEEQESRRRLLHASFASAGWQATLAEAICADSSNYAGYARWSPALRRLAIAPTWTISARAPNGKGFGPYSNWPVAMDAAKYPALHMARATGGLTIPLSCVMEKYNREGKWFTDHELRSRDPDLDDSTRIFKSEVMLYQAPHEKVVAESRKRCRELLVSFDVASRLKIQVYDLRTGETVSQGMEFAQQADFQKAFGGVYEYIQRILNVESLPPAVTPDDKQRWLATLGSASSVAAAAEIRIAYLAGWIADKGIKALRLDNLSPAELKTIVDSSLTNRGRLARQLLDRSTVSP